MKSFRNEFVTTRLKYTSKHTHTHSEKLIHNKNIKIIGVTTTQTYMYLCIIESNDKLNHSEKLVTKKLNPTIYR